VVDDLDENTIHTKKKIICFITHNNIYNLFLNK
jgi:hypothetical protein